jgi:hypothetical protein
MKSKKGLSQRNIEIFFLILLFGGLSCSTINLFKPNEESYQPNIGGFLNLDSVDGLNWPTNSSVNISLYTKSGGTLLYNGTSSTDENGHFYQSVGVDLVPGMMIEGTNGKIKKYVVLVNLTIDNVDIKSGIISGTAIANSKVNILYGSWQSVLSDNNGGWEAKFDVSDNIPKNGVQVEIPDNDGDRTVIKMEV